MEHYRFVKPYDMGDWQVSEGIELSIINGVVYYEGGILMDIYQAPFLRLVDREKKTGFNYLRPYKPVYNKV